jgi:hypothetical protein
MFLCSQLLLDFGTSQELRMGGTRFLGKIHAPKKYLNLKLFGNIGRTIQQKPTSAR